MKSGEKQNEAKTTKTKQQKLEIRVRLPCSDSACQHLGVLCETDSFFFNPWLFKSFESNFYKTQWLYVTEYFFF